MQAEPCRAAPVASGRKGRRKAPYQRRRKRNGLSRIVASGDGQACTCRDTKGVLMQEHFIRTDAIFIGLGGPKRPAAGTRLPISNAAAG